MANLTIENVPNDIINTYGTKVSYKSVQLSFGSQKTAISPKKSAVDATVRLQKLVYDPNNTSYGPFE